MPKLVNLGSLCIDRVYEVDQITRAGETRASNSFALFAGGKGLNQSLAAARAGCEVRHFGRIGADGEWLVELLADAKVNTDGVRIDDAASGHAVIQIAPDGNNSIVIVGGANRMLTTSDVDAAVAACEPGDWLLLQNETNRLDQVLTKAKQHSVRVCMNLAPYDDRANDYPLDLLSLLVVNEIEAAGLAGSDDPSECLTRLTARYPAMDVVVTLGEDGLVYGRGDDHGALPAFAVTAIDGTAAGDAFIGYLMAALVGGASLETSLRTASAAGALATTVVGAAPSVPLRSAVDAFLASADAEAQVRS